MSVHSTRYRACRVRVCVSVVCVSSVCVAPPSRPFGRLVGSRHACACVRPGSRGPRSPRRAARVACRRRPAPPRARLHAAAGQTTEQCMRRSHARARRGRQARQREAAGARPDAARRRSRWSVAVGCSRGRPPCSPHLSLCVETFCCRHIYSKVLPNDGSINPNHGRAPRCALRPLVADPRGAGLARAREHARHLGVGGAEAGGRPRDPPPYGRFSDARPCARSRSVCNRPTLVRETDHIFLTGGR